MSDKSSKLDFCCNGEYLQQSESTSSVQPDDAHADLLLPRSVTITIEVNGRICVKSDESLILHDECIDDVLKVHRFKEEKNWVGLELLSTVHPFLWFRFSSSDFVERLVQTVRSHQAKIDISEIMPNYNAYMADVIRKQLIASRNHVARVQRKAAKSMMGAPLPKFTTSLSPSGSATTISQKANTTETVIATTSSIPPNVQSSNKEAIVSPIKVSASVEPEGSTGSTTIIRRARRKSAIEVASMLMEDIGSPRANREPLAQGICSGPSHFTMTIPSEPSAKNTPQPNLSNRNQSTNSKFNTSNSVSVHSTDVQSVIGTKQILLTLVVLDTFSRKETEGVEPARQVIRPRLPISSTPLEPLLLDTDVLFAYLHRIPSVKHIWELLLFESEARRLVQQNFLLSMLNGVREVLWQAQVDLLESRPLIKRVNRRRSVTSVGAVDSNVELLSEFDEDIVHREKITVEGIQLSSDVDVLVRELLHSKHSEYNRRREHLENTERNHWEKRLLEREENVWREIQAEMDTMVTSVQRIEDEAKTIHDKLKEESTIVRRQMEEIATLKEREETLLHHARQKEGELHQKIRRLTQELKSGEKGTPNKTDTPLGMRADSSVSQDNGFFKRLF